MGPSGRDAVRQGSPYRRLFPHAAGKPLFGSGRRGPSPEFARGLNGSRFRRRSYRGLHGRSRDGMARARFRSDAPSGMRNGPTGTTRNLRRCSVRSPEGSRTHGQPSQSRPSPGFGRWCAAVRVSRRGRGSGASKPTRARQRRSAAHCARRCARFADGAGVWVSGPARARQGRTSARGLAHKWACGVGRRARGTAGARSVRARRRRRARANLVRMLRGPWLCARILPRRMV